MTGLEDAFGSDFADHVSQRVQERRAEREKISDETAMAIADLAINQGAFEGGDPMFEYTTDEGITHNVLLMQLAEPREGSVWQQANQLDSGAVSIPLDYLGQWIWSIFNDKSMAKKMEPGEWYIVVGNLTQWERDDGSSQDQFSPVRGVLSLEEAKSLANEAMEGESSASTEDVIPTDDEPEEDEEDDSVKESIFGGEEEEEDPEEEEPEQEDFSDVDVTYEEVANTVEDLADQEPEVWEVTPEHSEFDTFMQVLCEKLGLDYSEERVRKAVANMALDRINEGQKDDDEDDEESKLF